MLPAVGWLRHGAPERIALLNCGGLSRSLNLLDHLVHTVDEEHDRVARLRHLQRLVDRLGFVQGDGKWQGRLGTTDGLGYEVGDFASLASAQVVVLAHYNRIKRIGCHHRKLLYVCVSTVAGGRHHSYLTA